MSSWWGEDHKLLLISKQEFDALPDGEVLTCIDDTTAVKGKDEIDDDTRGGCLAYGVVGNHPLRVARLEALIAAPKPPPRVLPDHRAWSCKIGIIGEAILPPGCDAPMRDAVERAFFEITGKHAEFNFSGWGAQLEPTEYDVVANQQ